MSEIEKGERDTIAPSASSESAALPAPPATPRSSRPPPVPASVLMLDRISEIVGIIAVTYLCAGGKVPGELALIAIGAILGVQSGIRQIGSRGAAAMTGTGASLGIVGLLFWQAMPLLEHIAVGLGRIKGVAVLTVVALFVACGPARSALMAVTPGVPPVSQGVDAGLNRCEGNVPVVCSTSGRCWPVLPRDAYGNQRVCAGGCEVTDAGIALCRSTDASAGEAE